MSLYPGAPRVIGKNHGHGVEPNVTMDSHVFRL